MTSRGVRSDEVMRIIQELCYDNYANLGDTVHNEKASIDQPIYLPKAGYYFRSDQE
jgi:hypothetical protein